MERAYIDELNHAYDNFFIERKKHASPVLVIDANQIDFVRNPEDLRWIENRIRQALQMSPFQPELPLRAQNNGQ